MKKQSHLTHFYTGALVLSLGLLPLAAFAENNDGARLSLPVTVGTHLEAQGDENVSAESRTDVSSREQDGDNNEQDSEATSTKSDNRHNVERASKHGQEDMNENEGGDEMNLDQNEATDATTTIETEGKVNTRGELRRFLNHLIKADNHIADVHVSSTSVETHYALPAKFLWSIPANLTADVSVNADGSVTVTYPWYAFLFAKNDGVDAKLTGVTSSSVGATTTTSLSASTQAHLLNALFMALKNSSN